MGKRGRAAFGATAGPDADRLQKPPEAQVPLLFAARLSPLLLESCGNDSVCGSWHFAAGRIGIVDLIDGTGFEQPQHVPPVEGLFVCLVP